MCEYTGEYTYKIRKCRRCLFNQPCLICDFVHEDLNKWEQVLGFTVKRFHRPIRRQSPASVVHKGEEPAEEGHALLDNADSEDKPAI